MEQFSFLMRCYEHSRPIFGKNQREYPSILQSDQRVLALAGWQNMPTFHMLVRILVYLFQSISIAIQRGNSSCVLGTVPHSEGLDEVFEFVTDT